MKRIVVIGSTGSIGTQTLDVVREHKNAFDVVALVGNRNIALLQQQINEFHPLIAGTFVENVQKPDVQNHAVRWRAGMDEITAMIRETKADIVVLAVSGAVGLTPALAAIESEKHVALATKEVMVLAGELIQKKRDAINKSRKKRGKPPIALLPIDSEHSAIWQCLRSGDYPEIEKIILTCSGGPFRGRTKEALKNVTAADALKHPTWKMGKKITIDSATLMNKGLEVIEARWLFDAPLEKIEVVIHPQSILHSAVQFCDGSVIGQLGVPDMRLPIQYALAYPKRYVNTFPRLSLTDIGSLTFDKPDSDVFSCLRLAHDALVVGGTMPTVLNAANEVAVDLFLRGSVRFVDIPLLIERTMVKHSAVKNPTMTDIVQTDRWARGVARMIGQRISTTGNVAYA